MVITTNLSQTKKCGKDVNWNVQTIEARRERN
jgi:hypothetical protein